MSSILLSLPEFYASYKNWVSANPQLASEYETAAKYISYIIAGKINNSHIISELVYCSSNLLVLFNDRIINNVTKLELPSSGDTLKLWLTVVEYCEVLLELTSKRFWGTTGKWLIILSIQVFKCVARLFLIYKYKENIIQMPPISPLERTKFTAKKLGEIGGISQEPMTFTLKSTGRVVRRIEGAPPSSMRTWKPLQNQPPVENEQNVEEAIKGRLLVAETIFIAKPIVHLASARCFGINTWKPWIISLAMDLISLQLYHSYKNSKVNSLSPKQRLQLSKRSLILVMYLVRSPFYEQHTKDRINALLISFGKNVPLAKLICGPLLMYLPFWQSNYFYMWSS